jgi:hypothetical protein
MPGAALGFMSVVAAPRAPAFAQALVDIAEKLVRSFPGARAWPLGLRVFARCPERWGAGDDLTVTSTIEIVLAASASLSFRDGFSMFGVCSWCRGLVDLRGALPCRRMGSVCSVMGSACTRGIMFFCFGHS